MDAQCNWNTMESSHPSPQLFQEILSLRSPIFCLWNNLPSPLLNSSHSSFLIISGSLHEDFSSVWLEFHTIICSSCWGRSTKPVSDHTVTYFSVFAHSFCTWFVYLTLMTTWNPVGFLLLFVGGGDSGGLVFVYLFICLFLRDRIFLCISGSPQTISVNLAGFALQRSGCLRLPGCWD